VNSVARYLTPATLASTLLAMRSGRKEIFLIVEGGDDISLFSQVFGLPRSNFLDCRGKGNLMALFALVPTRGLDNGTVFVRDRDHDDIRHTDNDGVILLVSDLYDFEMQLLDGRLFGRLMTEFLRASGGSVAINQAFAHIVGAAAWLGALRLYAHEVSVALDFDGLRLTFIDTRTLSVDVSDMVRKVFARSSLKADISSVVARIEEIMAEAGKPSEIACGKDVLAILSLALNRHYKCCSAGECSIATLGRMLRVSASLEDLQAMTLYPRLATVVSTGPFQWGNLVIAHAPPKRKR
jgi:hypothetical protein